MNSVAYNFSKNMWRMFLNLSLCYMVYNNHGLAWGLCSLLGIMTINSLFMLHNEER